MTEEKSEAEEKSGPKGALGLGSFDTEDVFEDAEPWDPIETKMVLGSFAAALFFLAVFAVLIHKYVLH